jgi:acetyl esterase/lipase
VQVTELRANAGSLGLAFGVVAALLLGCSESAPPSVTPGSDGGRASTPSGGAASGVAGSGGVSAVAAEGGSTALSSPAGAPHGSAGASGGAVAAAGHGGGGTPPGAGAAGSPASAGAELEAPKPDRASSLPVASAGGAYTVEGNLPYGPLPRQRLDVLYPKGAGPHGTQTLPGVIMFHGGGWIQGDKATMSSFYTRFLSHGFVVCTVEYRVADDSADGAIAPAAVEDALLAAKWFWSYLDYYRVDRSKYVVTGASAGGHLALMVGMATPEAMLGPTSPAEYRIAAIVNGYGPTDVADLLQRGTSFAVQWLPSGTPDRDALAVRTSPVTYVRQELPPLITVHGSKDNTVPVPQAEKLQQLLMAAGAEAELHLVDGAGHGFSTPDTAWPDAEQAIFGFLTAHGIGK